jgi:hypothetical protein
MGGKNRALEAAVELGLMDHGILGREKARELAAAMGLDDRAIPFYALEHRPDQIKGAILSGCTRVGEKRVGIGADELAAWACRQLALEYRDCFGRGAQLRVCCEALVQHFGKDDVRN